MLPLGLYLNRYVSLVQFRDEYRELSGEFKPDGYLGIKTD